MAVRKGKCTFFGVAKALARSGALFAGVMLAVAGCIIQRLTGNPMASPEVLVRNPSARMAWSEVDDDVLLFASGQSRYLPGKLRELLKLVCSADALHSDNLGAWLADEDGRDLLCELVKQGSLGFADE